jgi:two-component system OmpR family response regulator
MRILLIEDDADVARLVVTGMAEMGHQVVHADNGEAGFATALAERFDVMIFDRQLPNEVDGANLLQELRARDVATPVLFLSGLGGLTDWIKGLDAGGDDYIVKPFAFQDLLARAEMLHKRAMGEVTGS